MPPKGHLKPVSDLGSVELRGSTWRVNATVNKRNVCGPDRRTEAEANGDLALAQMPSTREQYVETLTRLKRRDVASDVKTVVDIPEGVPSESSRKRLRIKSAPNRDAGQAAAQSSTPAVASSNGLSREEEEPASR